MAWKKVKKNLCTVSKHKLMMTYVRANLAQILTLAECAQRGQSLWRVDFQSLWSFELTRFILDFHIFCLNIFTSENISWNCRSIRIYQIANSKTLTPLWCVLFYVVATSPRPSIHHNLRIRERKMAIIEIVVAFLLRRN